jgi:protein involved in sex pheromone biosynthesis
VKKMKKHLIILVLAACVAMMSLAGCKDKPAEEETVVVKTAAEYKQQAEQEITKDNMLDELG